MSDRNSLVLIGFILGFIAGCMLVSLFFAHTVDRTELRYREKLINHGVAHWEAEADGSTKFVEHPLPESEAE